jgi:PE family
MTYVMAAPEMLAAAAADVAAVGSAVSAAHLAAAAPTVGLIPAAADEVSASIARVFSRAAQEYQALAGKAAAFQQQFVQHLNASAGWYAATEAANAAVLQPLTASAGSAASAISDLPGQLLNALTSFIDVSQFLVNASVFLVQASIFLAQGLPFLAIITAYVTLLAAFVGLVLTDLLLKAVLAFVFGVSIPF